MSSFSAHEGPWQPLHGGMPIPADPIDAEPQRRVCFPASWEPAVNQALTLLVRPESWAGDLTAVRAVVLEAQELLGRVANSEPCISCPNWRLTQANTDLGCAISLAVEKLWEADCGDCPHTVIYGIGAPIEAGALAGIALEGRNDPAPGVLVGGHICRLHCHIVDGTVGNVWTLNWRDCLGVNHGEVIGGSLLDKVDFTAQSICLLSLGGFAGTISISGDWLCGPA